MAMIAIIFAIVWFIYLLFSITKLIRYFLLRVKEFDHKIDGIKYLVEDVKSKFLNFLLKIINIKSKKI